MFHLYKRTGVNKNMFHHPMTRLTRTQMQSDHVQGPGMES